MEFWKSVDNDGKSKDVKVIIGGKLLHYNGTRISDFTIEELANMYDFYDINNSKKLCIIDDNGNNKTFRVCIDDNVFIPTMVDSLCFITGGNVPYFNNNNSVIEGTISDPNDKDNSSIIFAMQLKDAVFIDIENTDGIIVIKINTCDSSIGNIISSMKDETKINSSRD